MDLLQKCAQCSVFVKDDSPLTETFYEIKKQCYAKLIIFTHSSLKLVAVNLYDEVECYLFCEVNCYAKNF